MVTLCGAFGTLALAAGTSDQRRSRHTSSSGAVPTHRITVFPFAIRCENTLQKACLQISCLSDSKVVTLGSSKFSRHEIFFIVLFRIKMFLSLSMLHGERPISKSTFLHFGKNFNA